MLRIIFPNESRERPVKEFFQQPLSANNIEHKFHLIDNMPAFDKTDVVLAMGTKSLEYYRQHSLVKKNLSLNKLRNQVHMIRDIPTIFSFDPTLAKIDPPREPDIQWDINLAIRYIRTGSTDPVLGEYSYVTDFSDNILDLYAHKEKTKAPMLACLDLETIGLDEFNPEGRIVTVQLTTQQGKTSVYCVPESGKPPKEVLEQIELFCTSKDVKLTGANLKFDQRWIMQHWGIWISNQTFDTGVVGAVLNENRGNSLNLHAKLFTELGGYDDAFERDHDKSRMDIALKDDPEGFLTYSGGDTDACYRVTKRLRHDLMQDKALTNFYVNLLQPAAESFAMMEHRGVVVDINRYKELEIEVGNHIEDLENQIFGQMSKRLKTRYADNLSLGRAALLNDYMFSPLGLNLTPQMTTEKTGAPSTTMEHFLMFEEVPEAKMFIELMKEHRSASKTLSTYIKGFMKHIRSDGKFHPAYRMFRGDYGGGKDEGTVTGRTSATDPAYQTIPKHTIWAKPLRSVYVPPEGMAILKVDYSQGELRVAAVVANEPTMIKTYNEGLDLHLRTGSMVYGMPFDEALRLKAAGDKQVKVIRQGGKAGNFGLIYGMQAEGFQQYALTAYGVSLSLAEATTFRDNFFAEYPRLLPWHNASIGTARRHGYIRSPLGRIRHLPLIDARFSGPRSQAERQSINSPIQCTLSDLALLASVELRRAYPDLWLFGMTHDELAFYVPEDDVELWANRIVDVMENLPLKEKFNWDVPLVFEADAEYSVTNMSDCIEMDWLKKAA